MIKCFLRGERGTTAIEYTLIASLISMAIIAGMSLWSDKATDMFTVIQNAVAP